MVQFFVAVTVIGTHFHVRLLACLCLHVSLYSDANVQHHTTLSPFLLQSMPDTGRALSHLAFATTTA